jgi:hypothetical protein
MPLRVKIRGENMGVLDGNEPQLPKVEQTVDFSEPEEGDNSIIVSMINGDKEEIILGRIYAVWTGECVFTPPDVDEYDLTADELIQIAQKLRELNKR